METTTITNMEVRLKISQQLHKDIKAVAKSNKRTMAKEIEQAIENHIKNQNQWKSQEQ